MTLGVFLQMTTYRNPALTVDALVARGSAEDMKFQLLLIQRGREPFKGDWAFPGKISNNFCLNCIMNI